MSMLASLGRGYAKASSLAEHEVFGNEVNALYLDAALALLKVSFTRLKTLVWAIAQILTSLS